MTAVMSYLGYVVAAGRADLPRIISSVRVSCGVAETTKNLVRGGGPLKMNLRLGSTDAAAAITNTNAFLLTSGSKNPLLVTSEEIGAAAID